MERYTVTVVPNGGTERIRLLIPFSPTNLVIALTQEIHHRIARLGNWPGLDGLEAIVLRVDQEDGPMLDDHDVLSSVIIDPRTEVVFATPRRTATQNATNLSNAVNMGQAQTLAASVEPQQQEQQDLGLREPGDDEVFKIRVITAALAKTHKDLRSLPTSSPSITRKTTLAQIRARVATHLGLVEVEQQDHDEGECNCSFARQVVRRGIPESLNVSVSSSDQNGTDNKAWKFVVIYGKGKVQIAATEDPEKEAVLAVLRTTFGYDRVEGKDFTFIGDQGATGGEKYSCMPVVAICSQERHFRAPPSNGTSQKKRCIDLHTVEMPIATRNGNLTVEETDLGALVVDGVLNIYVVERECTSTRAGDGLGKDALFAASDHWHPKVRQTERGMAMYLSCLRVVSEMVGKRKADTPFRDAFLHMIDLLVRFPPALRTMFILMNGKTPRPIECSALSQAIYETLHDMIPLDLVQSDKSRLFEGARLFFGLVLDKAKFLTLPKEISSAYLSSFQDHDLAGIGTMEPVKDAVSTQSGLCERGYYEAFCIGGPLSGHGDSTEEPLHELPLHPRVKRIALLNAGLSRTVSCLDINSLNANYHYEDAGDLDQVLIRQELSDVHHLAALCERNNLAVLSPLSLASAKAPVLTMDRDGLLAVYTGRQACALPGQDIALFRPTKTPTEATVDVAIIMQLLAPILEQRKADGTSVFDAFGGSHTRRFDTPDEILIFCVDCSASMDTAAGFMDIEDTDQSQAESTQALMPERDVRDTDGSYTTPGLDDLKGLVMKHESFEDMVAIISGTSPVQHRSVADKIVDILMSFLREELLHRTEELGQLRERSTGRYLANALPTFEAPIKELKAYISGLQGHKQSISNFLIFHATKSNMFQQPWIWRVGQPVPERIRREDTFEDLSPDIVAVPHEYVCPLSRDVLEDPVITSDGFTYERNAIARWLHISKSSPMTGLELQNAVLRDNRQLLDEVEAWIRAEDILGSDATTHSRKRARVSSDGSSAAALTLRFFSEMGSFDRKVPLLLSVSDLYKVAFRGLKGRHTRFQLFLGNSRVEPSANLLSIAGIVDGSELYIRTQNSASTSDQRLTPNTRTEKLCLIKVYGKADKILFSYWVNKSTKQTLASVVWKWWRWVFTERVSCPPCSARVWSDLTHRGDGRLNGDARQAWDKLSTLLTPEHANGSLQHEKVYQEKPDGQGSGNAEDTPDWSIDYSMDENWISEDDEGSGTDPLVLKLLLIATRAKTPEKRLTRLDISKQMFDAFVNRILAYSYKTHMGLITFETTASVAQPLTDVVENFRKQMTRSKATGDTALWDALSLAEDQLMQYAQQYPDAKKRIICLSDGNDTKSLKECFEIYPGLVRNNIVVDSVSIGAEDNQSLRTISYLSGGYKFVPKTLEQAMAICEMEPVLSQLERPAITLPMKAVPSQFDANTHFKSALRVATPEIVTRDVFPLRREHPNERDEFVELSAVTRRLTAQNGVTSAPRANANLHSARLLSECRNILANPHPYYDVYVSERDISFWKIVLEGPHESAYEGGTFIFYLHMEPTYPAFPPKGRFITPILHPNINQHGRICHSIFDRNWTSDTTNSQVLNTVFGLLLVPEFSDRINAVVTLNFQWDEAAFKEEAKAHMAKHASKSRATWRAELLGE